jgi:hypothetical protein
MLFGDFDWAQVGRSALIGGVVGACVGAVFYVVKLFQKKNAGPGGGDSAGE